MLRSTGFFRGIDCPFYKEHCDGRDVCNRPYCHFRHSKHRRASYGAAIDVKKQKELDSKQKEQGYDPFKPEVERPEEQENGESSGSSDLSGTLQLEMVNRAIEEVRSEVEREKRKLSRIGDQEYDPSSNSTLSTVAVPKRPNPKVSKASHLDYNPTPRSSKYTLDSDGRGERVSSTEYVPTSVKKPIPRTQPLQLPSPPPSPKYSTNKPSKCKYILDNSKPSTDMEYDPLSNYSARIAGKNKRDGRTDTAKTEGNKTRKPPGSGHFLAGQEYVPTAKKPRQQAAGEQKYTLSDSDEASSGTEYRPTSLSRLHRRKGSSGSAEDAVGTGRRERTESGERGEETEDSENHDAGQQKHRPENKAVAKCIPGKSGKSDKLHKGEKDSSKTSGACKDGGGKDKASASGDGKDKVPVRKPSHDLVKKDGEGKKDEVKVKTKDKSIDGAKRDGREEKRIDGKVKTIEKVKSELAKREKEREKGVGESKTAKLSEKESGNKQKDHVHKNGQIDTSRKEKDLKKSKSTSISSSKQCSSKSSNSKIGSNSSNSKTGSNSTSSNSNSTSSNSNSTSSNSKNTSNSINSKVGSSSSKNKLKKNSNSSGGKTTVKDRNQSLSLSHVDLFGDESPEEAEPMEEDDDDEEEEVLVRKSAAIRRVSLSKRKASELTPSSSEGEGGAYRDEIDSGGVDYSSLQVDLDFDSDPLEECLRIFNESKDVKREDKGRQAKQQPRDSDSEEDTESTLTTLFPGQKKRVSHFSAKGSESASKQVVRPYRRQSAQEICYQRMQIAQQQAAQLAAAVKMASTSPGSTSNPIFPGERKRVAHRPNTPASSSSKSGPADAKPAVGRVLAPSKTLTAHLSIKAHTSAGILSKTTSTIAQRRVAHTPTMKSTSMKRPVIPTEFGAKVPTNIRQRYLTTFIDECIKFCLSEEVAFQMALDEEKMVYERSSSKNIYLSVAANTLTKLRSKSNSTSSPVTKAPAAVCHRKTLSHEELLGGRLAATTSFTVNRMGKQQEVKLAGASLFRKLRDYLMTEEQLEEHGYPRVHPEASGRAVIHNQPEKKISPDPFSKICCRCGAEYKINIHGSCVRKEECNHHWGRLRRHKGSGGWETTYSCCLGAVGSPGCQVSKQHVQDGRKECVDGYVKTFDKDLPPDGNAGVYALDCEMCYTTLGLELTRVTVINSDLKVIYDTFVKPESKVVDYNTRFSGVTEEDLENATITLRDVQAVLLNMFSSESILIGHSLESDLLALKVIHSTVVDTAIVFPHRLGLPYKRALRNLMAEHLKRIIQDNVEGHDSSEDASACMELMMWRIKEDAKVKR